MRKFYRVNILLVLFTLICLKKTNAQLVINEVSQGTGSQEYVEFLVVGTPNCTSDCVDLRNWIIDDNNGTFATGSSTGIAPGCFKFNNVSFWSCIKIGTIILIYDPANKNVNITQADDLSTTDGNCKLIIPISNTTLFSGTTNNSSSFPPSFASNTSNTWGGPLSMNNTNDSFQTRNPNSSYSLHHSISWGNNTNNTQLYFTSTGAQVRSMKNIVDDDIFNIANWTDDPVSTIGSQTPGAPNNAANAAWINTLSNTCSNIGGTPINTVTITSNPNGSYCDGQQINLLSTINPTSATVTYEWFKNNISTGTVNSLTINVTNIPTTYTLKVTDLCSNTISSNNLVITSSGAITSVTINYTPACSGNITTLTCNTTPANMSALIYSWKKNGSAVGIFSTLITTITSTTTTYTLNITDACSNTVGDTKIIAEAPINSNFFPNSNEICKVGTSLILTPTTNGGTWSISPSTAAFNNATGVFDYTTLALNTYTVTYLFSTPCVTSSTQTYSFKEKPLAVISSLAGHFCDGNTVKLSANLPTTNNGSYTYLWQPTNSIANFIDVTSTSTHTVTVSNACGSTTSSINSTQFISNPPNFTPNSSLLCETDNIIIFTPVTNGGSFSITPATPAFNSTNKTFNPTLADKNINYKISYSFGGNCPATEIKTFTVEKNDTAKIITNKEAPYCNAEEVILHSTTSQNNIWSTNDTTQSITIKTSGTYSLTVTGCYNNKTTDKIEIAYSNVFADFYPNTINGTPPLEVVFLNLSSESSRNYFWNFGDSATSNLKSPTHTYITSGEYLVSLIVKNDEGCTDTALYKFIKVTDNNYLYIPNTFTPNNDGLNDFFAPKTSALLSYNCLIYNRWGELVFESNDIKQMWNASNTSDAVFVYKIKVQFLDNTKKEITGTLTVLH